MNTTDLRTQIRTYLDDLDIVDAHEHFTPEQYHANNYYNFYHWMMPYIQYDLISAGMTSRYLWNAPKNDLEIDECYQAFAPYWKHVKYGSYARPCRMALKEFFGFDDITDENYKEIGVRMRASTYPGRYKEILEDRCHIRYMLNQTGSASYQDAYMKGSYAAVNKINGNDIAGFLEKNPGAGIQDYLDSVEAEISAAAAAGAVLVKYDTTSFITEIDEEKAKAQFEDIRRDGPGAFRYGSLLTTYLFEKMLDMTERAGIVAAVHTGVWGNITMKNPEIVFPVLERHPSLRFDIYHMGMPYVRECAFLGKNYANAYLNMCWSHIVSSEMTVNALEEWLDLIPVNKIIGFGGDFSTMPENIWAHLEIAKENFAEVFARRIEKGKLTLDEAKHILKMWMYDTPVALYRLSE
jgi:uncharacterized protein